MEAEPTITAKEVKEENPQHLQQMSVGTIQNLLRDDLGYKHWAPYCKLIVSDRTKTCAIF